MTGRLERFLAAEGAPVEAALRRAVDALVPALGAPALYAVRAGGKRIRPLLVVASFRAAGGGSRGGGEGVYDVAAAVELVHTYSLLHDDLPSMDDDRLRRGLPTVHLVYGVEAATAAGAALQQRAFLALGEAVRREPALGPELPAMVRRLARAAGVEGMVGGQYLDLEAEGREVDPAGLEAIHRAKTGALISAACALGGHAARAGREAIDALADYGASLGLAFQVVDDLLNVTGDPARTGKASGSDAARSKATYVAVHGIDGARGQAETAAGLAREAVARLDGPAVAVLHDFVDYVLERIH